MAKNGMCIIEERIGSHKRHVSLANLQARGPHADDATSTQPTDNDRFPLWRLPELLRMRDYLVKNVKHNDQHFPSRNDI
ncbi:hypothetical protein KIN20_013702 [Parelaphostrongylus tenuis]|uniref:Uncharacterized protein n=1 Tax=Parelaphostrongylus tenuis TaxID=148309 RepID=A0AAD5MDZ0_PARTN|nr:hypothetical protein KIN20_013702 [Parelaphostrongylus tenuis]